MREAAKRGRIATEAANDVEDFGELPFSSKRDATTITDDSESDAVVGTADGTFDGVVDGMDEGT